MRGLLFIVAPNDAASAVRFVNTFLSCVPGRTSLIWDGQQTEMRGKHHDVSIRQSDQVRAVVAAMPAADIDTIDVHVIHFEPLSLAVNIPYTFFELLRSVAASKLLGKRLRVYTDTTEASIAEKINLSCISVTDAARKKHNALRLPAVLFHCPLVQCGDLSRIKRVISLSSSPSDSNEALQCIRSQGILTDTELARAIVRAYSIDKLRNAPRLFVEWQPSAQWDAATRRAKVLLVPTGDAIVHVHGIESVSNLLHAFRVPAMPVPPGEHTQLLPPDLPVPPVVHRCIAGLAAVVDDTTLYSIDVCSEGHRDATGFVVRIIIPPAPEWEEEEGDAASTPSLHRSPCEDPCPPECDACVSHPIAPRELECHICLAVHGDALPNYYFACDHAWSAECATRWLYSGMRTTKYGPDSSFLMEQLRDYAMGLEEIRPPTGCPVCRAPPCFEFLRETWHRELPFARLLRTDVGRTVHAAHGYVAPRPRQTLYQRIRSLFAWLLRVPFNAPTRDRDDVIASFACWVDILRSRASVL